MKHITITGFLYFLVIMAFATHERAGEITYKHLDGYTYEFTLITYTFSPSPADRPELEVKWGDGSSSVLPRNQFIDLPDDIRQNSYIGQHTFAGGGIFKISMEDPNRNLGIVNIPNSVNIPFYIETELYINPFLGHNNSVQLLNPPLDYGCTGKLYVHNPGVYDPDGDSISYKLTVCKGGEGLPIPGYSYPQASSAFYLDEYSGDLIWDKPVIQGEYNVAFIVEEWRLGQRIGYVTRDLQIEILACNNNPPDIYTIGDTCVIAGDTLTFGAYTLDPDGDIAKITAFGAPFEMPESPATYSLNPAADSLVFTWRTRCSHIRKNPHFVYFKAMDFGNTVNLVSYKTINITVLCPPPELLAVIPFGNAMQLSWNPPGCQNFSGFNIYRRTGSSGYEPGYCETGIPPEEGYTLIKATDNNTTLTFIDDNNGAGLAHGIDYCYRVTAFFQDGTESIVSDEICAMLKRDVPIITNVSITTTDPSGGGIYVAWAKPTELDLSQTPGPFRYEVMRINPSAGTELNVKTYTGLNDTIFHDTLLNTKDFKYRYRIDFFNDTPGNTFKIGSSQTASSIFLEIGETDGLLKLSWNTDVPWNNNHYNVFRFNPGIPGFEMIAQTLSPDYDDTGLSNGTEYCYYIETVGSYSTPGLVNPVINLSQRNCGVPVDNIPPCPPVLTVVPDCDLFINTLNWIYPDTCPTENLVYNVYYQAYTTQEPEIIAENLITTNYVFENQPYSIVGCFFVTALDSLFNESLPGNKVCIDLLTCSRYALPNVFTPNNDQSNDLFLPFPPKEWQNLDPPFPLNSIEKIEISIFNRWGTEVFATEDPYIRWDGRDQNKGGNCSEGVYFYVCDVFEKTLGGTLKRTITGSITLLR